MVGRRVVASFLPIVFSVAVFAPLKAQPALSSNKPVGWVGDEVQVDNSKCLISLHGSPEAVQGQMRLRADDVIRIFRDLKGVDAQGQTNCGAANRIDADGNVYYVTPTQVAHGQHAIYTVADDQVVMTGDVIVVQGKDVARGDRLVIHLATHQAEMESDVKGRGQPHRVQGVFYPNQPASSAGPTGGPAASSPP